MEPEKRKAGRPKGTGTGAKTTHYNISLPNRVAPIVEMAKADIGLSALVTECLENYYQRKGTGADILHEDPKG